MDTNAILSAVLTLHSLINPSIALSNTQLSFIAPQR